MLWIAWKLYHIFVLLKLNQTHAALLCARLFVPRVLCCCKTLQKVRSRTSPLRLLRLTVVVAQTRHTDYEACRDDAALEECDVAIIVIDAKRGLESQDVNIISLAARQGKGMVIFFNKWDLIEKDSKTADKLRKEMVQSIAPIDYVPFVFGSATEKQRIFQVMEKAVEVCENRSQKVPTSALNDALLPEIVHYPPPAVKGKLIQIKYITQVPGATPSIAFFCNLPQYVAESYRRFLENRIRENFNFEGVPLRLFFRKK